MKIEIKNPRKIVDTAFCEKTKDSFSLFINTRGRARPTSYGYNCEADGSFDVVYDSNDNDGDQRVDQVSLIPENEQEKEWLSWLHFELQDKRQLWIIFLPERVYK